VTSGSGGRHRAQPEPRPPAPRFGGGPGDPRWLSQRRVQAASLTRPTSRPAWRQEDRPPSVPQLVASLEADNFIGGWLLNEQFDLALPAPFLIACGRAGLPLRICTNDGARRATSSTDRVGKLPESADIHECKENLHDATFPLERAFDAMSNERTSTMRSQGFAPGLWSGLACVARDL
jgi:hypothetical protein